MPNFGVAATSAWGHDFGVDAITFGIPISPFLHLLATLAWYPITLAWNP